VEQWSKMKNNFIPVYLWQMLLYILVVGGAYSLCLIGIITWLFCDGNLVHTCALCTSSSAGKYWTKYANIIRVYGNLVASGTFNKRNLVM